MNNLFKDLALLERIDLLIRSKSTGTPENLARKLGVSKRTLTRYIDDLREIGFPIVYDSSLCRYIYESDVRIRIEIQAADKIIYSKKSN